MTGEGLQAALRAEEVGAPEVVAAQGLDAIDLHPAHRIGRAAALREPEQRTEDREAEQVQEQLVVDLDGPEDVISRWRGPVGINPAALNSPSTTSAAITIVTNISAT